MPCCQAIDLRVMVMRGNKCRLTFLLQNDLAGHLCRGRKLLEGRTGCELCAAFTFDWLVRSCKRDVGA